MDGRDLIVYQIGSEDKPNQWRYIVASYKWEGYEIENRLKIGEFIDSTTDLESVFGGPVEIYKERA